MRYAIATVILLVAVALTGCTTVLGGDGDPVESRIEAPEEEETSRLRLPVGREGVSFSWINITRDGPSPQRLVAANGTTVAWRNLNAFGVYLSFPWMPRNFSIAAGGSRTMLLKGETTYTVYRNDTGAFLGEGYVRVGAVDQQ